MTYDQAQSPRLGQRTAVESTYVQMFDVDPDTPTPDLVEAAWPGMLVFRHDTNGLQIYDGTAGAWREVGSGNFTYVSAVVPPGTGYKTGDVWYDTDDAYQLYVWDESVPPEGGWAIAQDRVLTSSVITTEALMAGDLVNVYNSAGSARVRKAYAAIGLEAHGYVVKSYVAGEYAEFHHTGANTYVTGLTPGAQWLSDDLPGKATSTPPMNVNSIVQQIGYATNAGNLEFTAYISIKIV